MTPGARRLLRAVYNAVPFKRPLFGLLRPLNLPERLFRHLHFTGPFTIDVRPDASFRMISHGDIVENELFWSGYGGVFEGMTLRVWERLARAADGTILDIGANTGLFALAARSVNAEARVVAFEPVARIAAKLDANIALNGAGIEVVRKAVSDRTGTALFHDSADPAGDENAYSASLEEGFAVNDRDYQIETVRLDDWIGESAGAVALLKIDVELHEPAAVRGMAEILRRDRPSMVVEVLNAEIGAAIERQLGGLGYDYYKIDEDAGLVPMGSLDPMSGSSRNCLICTSDRFREARLSTLLLNEGPDPR